MSNYETPQNTPTELYSPRTGDKSQVWDYENPLPPKLSPEFYQSYIISIKGKQYVKVEGLVTLMHAKGFKSLITKMVTPPTQANGNTVVFKSTIVGYGWNPVSKAVEEVTVVGYGDANPGNVGQMVAAHFIRMAETRSIGRALRNYTNVNICTLDEIGSIIEVPKITSVQINQIVAIMGQYGLQQQDGINTMIKVTGKMDINTLTEEEGGVVINALNLLGKNKAAQPQPQIPNPSSIPHPVGTNNPDDVI